MSAAPSRASGMTWPLLVFSLPLLYVLTWPPIEIASLKFVRWRATGRFSPPQPPPPPSPTLSMTGSGTWILLVQPYILRLAYRPLHRITPFEKDPPHLLTRYWEGWCKLLDEAPGNHLWAEGSLAFFW